MQRGIPGVMRLLAALLAAAGLGSGSDVHIGKTTPPRTAPQRSAVHPRVYAAARRRTGMKNLMKRRSKGLTRAARKRSFSA